MTAAKTSEPMMMPGVGSKPNTISDQVAKLTIENFTKLMASDAATPIAPPMSARSTDSSRNENRMRPAREAERAQRADLALAIGDRGVHRDHRADHRADREEDGDHRPIALMNVAGALRLLLVVLRLLQDLEAELPVRFDAGLEGVELLAASSRTRTDETKPSRPKAVRTVSRSAQTSDSNDEPPSAKTPTTFTGRFFFSSKHCSSSRPLKRPRSALPTIASSVPGLGGAARRRS